MDEEQKDRTEQLASEHWHWLSNLLGHIYTDAFIHGYKHGVEEKSEEGA